MADAIIASVAEMLIITAKEHIESEIQLVRGVEKELLNLSDKLKAIRNVLDDAERRRYKDKGVNDWVVRLEQTSHEMEDVLEEWSYALLQHNIQQHHQLAAAAAHHNHHRKDKVVLNTPVYAGEHRTNTQRRAMGEEEFMDIAELKRRLLPIQEKFKEMASLSNEEVAELYQEFDEFKAIFAKFERAQNTPQPEPPVADTQPCLTPTVLAESETTRTETTDTTAHLINHPIDPSLNFDVDPCVDNELSIVLHPLDSHTQASSLSYLSLDFTKLDRIKDTNVLVSEHHILRGVKDDDLDLKAKGTIVVEDSDVNPRVEWLIAWSFKANERKVHEEKSTKPRVSWLIDWLVTIYFPP